MAYTRIKIELDDLVLKLTVEQAHELRDALNELIAPEPKLTWNPHTWASGSTKTYLADTAIQYARPQYACSCDGDCCDAS